MVWLDCFNPYFTFPHYLYNNVKKYNVNLNR